MCPRDCSAFNPALMGITLTVTVDGKRCASDGLTQRGLPDNRWALPKSAQRQPSKISLKVC